MIKLYGIGFSFNISKVRYCLNYLNLPYEWVQTNPMAGETKTADFINLCPTGKIPAIDVDGFKLFESNAIIRYLAAANNSVLYPQDNKIRALIDAWMDYSSIHVGAALGRVLFNRVFAPMMGQKADQESLKVGLEFLDKYFPVLERQLSQNPYIAGKEVSIADISLLATLDPCELAQINNIDQYPSIKKWRAALKAQAFYQKCYKDYSLFVQESMNAQAAK